MKEKEERDAAGAFLAAGARAGLPAAFVRNFGGGGGDERA